MTPPSSDATLDASGPASDAPMSRGLLRGRVVAGRYRIDALIGAGGMGLIYAATHLVLGTGVALKVLRPEFGDHPEFPRRFLNEARTTAALRGSHIVHVFDAGRLETGLPFLAMERLQGRDLAALLGSHGALSPGAAVDYVMQTCVGLAEAHAIGLVHRDIKRSNLFAASDGARRVKIKILDFGISRWASKPGEAPPDDLLGSPSYSSPEQIEDGNVVDRRTDIWSLGVVLFELLTGKSPFARSTVTETFSLVLRGPAPRLRDACPELEPGLAHVIDRCLQRQLEARFFSVLELRAALAPFAAMDPFGVRRLAERPATGRAEDGVWPARSRHGGKADSSPRGDPAAFRTILLGRPVN